MTRYRNPYADDDLTPEQEADMQEQLAFDFVQAIKLGNPNYAPSWTGTNIDYDACKRHNLPYNDKAPRKQRTIEEIFADSMQYPNGPSEADLVVLLSLCMKSSDKVVRGCATNLVKRCADVWARINVD